MTERKLVPHIRFKGFEEEWKKEKLGELGHTFSGLSGKSKDDFGHGKAKYVTYMNVYTNPIASKKELDAIEIDQKQHSVKYGDVFFTTSSETPEEVGMSSVWQYNWDNVYLNSFSFGYRPDKIFNLNYLAFVLRSQAVRNKIKVLAQGISRYNISKVKMMDIKVLFPNIAEQQKIGTFFAKLDRLLDLQQQKLDQLELLKKALLQKLFPKKDAKIPELRFKGFEDEWVRTKIKNIVQYSSSSFSISELKENNEGNTYPVYDATGTKYYSKKFDMHDDYIAIIKDGSNVGKTRLLPAKTSVLSTMGYLKALNSNILFDFYSITNTNFDKYKVGSGIPHIYFSDYKKECKLVPKIPEQQKIGNLLAKVDRLIELENNKVDNLKQVKKSLLQNMFVE